MKKPVTLIFLSLFVGCTTVEFVRKETVPQKQGILRHAPPSNDKKAGEYREKVNFTASDFCDGAFDITKEYQAREETGHSTGISTGVGFGMSGIMIGGANRGSRMYNFIEFACK